MDCHFSSMTNQDLNGISKAIRANICTFHVQLSSLRMQLKNDRHGAMQWAMQNRGPKATCAASQVPDGPNYRLIKRLFATAKKVKCELGLHS
jgi:hypothetical protein